MTYPSLPPSVVALGSLLLAGVVVLLIALRANARRARSERSMSRSIPEALARAKRQNRHVLVFFLEPGHELTTELLELAFHDDLARLLASFERVRVDAPADDLDVVNHVASKYGLPVVEPPTILALDSDGRRLDALVGRAATGETPSELRERFAELLEKARARF